MAPEHYDEAILSRTRRLYEQVRTWAQARDDVSWAVYEQVEAGHAMQSRDVDIVLHSDEAHEDLLKQLPEWNLQWRTKGGKRFPDAHFKDEDPLVFRLDVFTTKSTRLWTSRFGRQGAENVKPPPQDFIPSVSWLIEDKLVTIPKRRTPDAEDKRAKDFIDVYNLVFHNRTGQAPRTFREQVPDKLCEAAGGFLEHALVTHPEYADRLAILTEWLRD